MGRLIDGLVFEGEAGGEPALLDLWVDLAGAVQIGVDALKDSSVEGPGVSL